jgi:hypothetical protein
MKPRPVPRPVSARIASPSSKTGAAIAIVENTTMSASPTSPARRAPYRSLIRPPGICIARWVMKSAVVSRPIAARLTP